MSSGILIFCLFLLFYITQANNEIPFPFKTGDFERQYRPLSDSEKNQAKEDVLKMFYFGYDNYMKHAFPMDELGLNNF